MTETEPWDAVVIGAGFAGVTAARDLRKAGKTVLLLEARDRVGGRTWSRPWRGSGAEAPQVELGGTYINPTLQDSVRAEMERYGIEAVDALGIDQYVWELDGELLSGFPIPFEEIQGFETALYELKRNALRVPFGGPLPADVEELDIPVAEFFDRLDIGPKTRDLLLAWFDMYGGVPSETGSMLQNLWSINGLGSSPWSMLSVVGKKIAGGTGALIEAILADADVELRLETVVTAVAQDDFGVTVTTAAGERITAATVVVAVPVNCWAEIAFTPALDAPKTTMAQEKHRCLVRKVMVETTGAPAAFTLSRTPSSFASLVPDATYGEHTLFAGFAVLDGTLDLTDREVVQGMISRTFPGAVVTGIDEHNWGTDPYSQGAMIAFDSGRAFPLMENLAGGEGRVSFAGSDIALRWHAWIDGAIESGREAAARSLGILDGIDVAKLDAKVVA